MGDLQARILDCLRAGTSQGVEVGAHVLMLRHAASSIDLQVRLPVSPPSNDLRIVTVAELGLLSIERYDAVAALDDAADQVCLHRSLQAPTLPVVWAAIEQMLNQADAWSAMLNGPGRPRGRSHFAGVRR